MHAFHASLLLLSLLVPSAFASLLSFNQSRLYSLHKQWASNLYHKRYVTDSQIDSWISGSGPFPYYYQPSYTTSQVASCNSNENQFPGNTSPSSEDHAKRDQFVTRSGTKLYLGGYEFRPVGPNIYWLGLDENVNPNPSYPTQTRVLEMMGIASAMGANAIRSHTLGISFGTSLSVETGPNTFNDGAYDAIDFAIMAARVYGIKLIIPLVDNYNWYHGGKYQFIGWAGHAWSGTGAAITPADVGGFFYNDTNCVNMFTNYITHHLTHVNKYTNIAYKDDPTIMMWETGNELSVYQQDDGPPPTSWTQQICALIKSLAPNQLCMDGTFGIYPSSGQLGISNVDAYSDHFYPASVSRLQSGAQSVQNAGKVYIAGEWDWTGQYGGDDINAFMSAIQNIDGTGDFFWSLFGHDSDCCTLVTHNDGYTMYYPGTTSDMTTRASEVRNHFHSMTSNDSPQILPRVACATTTVSTLPSSTSSASSTSTTTTSTSHSTTATATPTKTLPAGWAYAACLAEPTQHSTSVRALASYESTQSALTDEWCVNTCSTSGYSLAGTENGNECYCGNTISNGGAVTSASNCVTQCSGDSTEICGGSWTLSLYSKAGSSPLGWTSLGCYVDSSTRALATIETSTTTMTSESCVAYCINNGYNYAGTEAGNECWCANSIQSGANTASSGDCATACVGNSAEKCGGNWRINIYQNPAVATTTTTTSTSTTSTTTTSHSTTTTTTSAASTSTAFPPGWVSLGCYVDSSTRALATAEMNFATLTTQTCMSYCQTNGYTYAGTEAGNECWCANSLQAGANTAPSGDCGTACVGNSAEDCGGNWRINIYQYGTTTTTSTTTTSAAPTSTAFPPGWVSLGCYVDSATRALATAEENFATLTTQTCMAYCQTNGYTYAGTEAGNECWCANSIQTGANTAPSGDCGTACVGNSAEDCGGNWRINIYQYGTTTTTSTTTTSAAPTSTAFPPGWTSLGCYVDSDYRALGTIEMNSATLTTQSCMAYCQTNGYSYAGTEAGNECWCANSILAGANTAPSGDCSTVCVGNSAEDCGGGWRINIYQYGTSTSTSTTSTTTTTSATATATSSPSWVSLGCYVDSDYRALGTAEMSSATLTTESCQAYCVSNGYAYAGTEAGNECWCANSILTGANTAPSGDCSTACVGNSAEPCGGNWRINIYQSVVSSGWSSVGCYVDPAARALPSKEETTTTMTIEICESYCATNGYSYAGVEAGNECWCDNSIQNGAALASPSDCATACVGNPNEICGGNWRINIYKKNNSKRSVSHKRSRRSHIGRNRLGEIEAALIH